MKLKNYIKHLNPIDINNPLDKYLRLSSSCTPTPREILCNEEYHGISATKINYHSHHVYLPSLFGNPKKRHTIRLIVSRQRHVELHKMLANCKSEADFHTYEKTIKSECPQITDDIAAIYLRRIKTLKTGLRLWLAKILKTT